MKTLIAAMLLLGASPAGTAPDVALSRIDADYQVNVGIADAIWKLAELGYQEKRSSALLQKRLKDNGFTVTAGVAGMETGFIASWSNGAGPAIGLLGEFDALPGLSQTTDPVKTPRAGSDNGHGCGHHLFSVASISAAIAIRDWMKATGTTGTIRFYGTPAEENGAGKVRMLRAGLFKDLDIVLHWHPGNENAADMLTTNTNISAKFRFHGVAAHAAGAPEMGRSALDGVEAMNMMSEMLREHVPQETRIHYVITAGGKVPNIVPDFAETDYFVRHPDPAAAGDTVERLVKIAKGAAMGTGTTVDYDIDDSVLSLLPNRTLQTLIHEKLSQVGGVTYTPEETSYAQKIIASLDGTKAKPGDAEQVQPLKELHIAGSTDVGDVSWNVPTGGFFTATWVPGTSAHSWQAVAAGGMSIGMKGMQNAAKVLALTAIELLEKPEIVRAAKAEFEDRRGKDFTYPQGEVAQ